MSASTEHDRSHIAHTLNNYIVPEKTHSYARVNFDMIVEAILEFETQTGHQLSLASFYALGYGFSFVDVIKGQPQPRIDLPLLLKNLDEATP